MKDQIVLAALIILSLLVYYILCKIRTKSCTTSNAEYWIQLYNNLPKEVVMSKYLDPLLSYHYLDRFYSISSESKHPAALALVFVISKYGTNSKKSERYRIFFAVIMLISLVLALALVASYIHLYFHSASILYVIFSDILKVLILASFIINIAVFLRLKSELSLYYSSPALNGIDAKIKKWSLLLAVFYPSMVLFLSFGMSIGFIYAGIKWVFVND
jgi:hypothetical protein